MKLKQRLGIIIIGVTAFLAVLLFMFSVFYYSELEPNYFSDSNFSEDQKLFFRRTISENIPKRRSLKKESGRKGGILNDTTGDSNHAGEVVLSDKEYEDLINKKQILPRTLSENPFGQTTDGPQLETLLMVKYVDECLKKKTARDPDDKREQFRDLLELLRDEETTFKLQKTLAVQSRITIKEIHNIELETNLTRMEQFHLGISDLDLYAEDDSNVDELLKEMETMPISHVEEKVGGTQLKLLITFQDGNQAMFKPMRFDRQKETEPNHFYFVDYERHTSEIAAFHLDRILGFRRCPPVVGRKLNITTEIYAVADDELLKTFFISPAQNICFHGHCSYYCDTSHAICGRPDTVEGSLAAFLPPDSLSGRKSWKNPWKRTYHKRRKAEWELNKDYCRIARKHPLYDNTKRLADLIDTSILDFLIGNMDRHHYETFKIFGNDSYILHLDHGRGFGKSKHDEISILAPLIQCCFIHITTFYRLMQLQLNPMKLSNLMRCSLYKDPLNPILLDPHLEALDRRLEIVLQVLTDCFRNNEASDVLYYNEDSEEENDFNNES